jgi:hypothetical protein
MIRLATSLFAVLVVTSGAAHAESWVRVETEGLRSNRSAAAICSDVAASSVWTGHWNTTEWGQMSVCNCAVGQFGSRFDVEAGPIWNQRHATQVCPTVCSSARWTGDWDRSTRRNVGSCTLAYTSAPVAPVHHVVPTRPVPVHVAPPMRPHRRPYLRGDIAVGGPNWQIRVSHR